MATAAKVPHTTEQLISFGINIIQKTGDFERALMEWHKMDRNLRTWQNLKDHFSKAHRALRKIRGTIIKNTPFHKANQMAHTELLGNAQRGKGETHGEDKAGG